MTNTMETLQQITLIVHIAAGFTALTVGLAPMFAQKGGRTHTIAGGIFFWAMMAVSASAVLTFFIKPYSTSRLFLLFIGVFSFYLAYTGVATIRYKKKTAPVRPADWTVSGIGMATGASMIGLSAWFFTTTEPNFFYGILYAVFGTFQARIAWADWQRYRQHGQPEGQKTAWFFTHMSRMLGAYIATVTAFCVVNGHYVPLPGLVLWLAPGLIGGIGINRWIRYYRKKGLPQPPPKERTLSGRRM